MYLYVLDTIMIILGCDVGSRNWGYCIAEITKDKKEILEKGHWYLSEPNIQDRLYNLEKSLSSLILEYGVDTLALEAPYMKNSKAAMDMYFCTAINVLLAAKYELPLHRYSAAEVKKFTTGTGKAEKIHIQKSVTEFFNLEEKFKDSHSADACAVCITCFNKESVN